MRSLTNTGFYISNRIGKAIADYNLIEDKDRILVAVSGGKDSMSMLKLLNERKKWAPIEYELIAMHVETDYACDRRSTTNAIKKFCRDNDIRLRVKKIRIMDKKRDTSCFWCSWNRRKALFLAADSLGCNKIALGHHKDDIIETLLLNIFYHGEFAAMNPRQELFRGKVIIIRPLCYVEEDKTRKFAGECGFRIRTCGCPNADTSKRKKMKRMIADIERDCKFVKTNIFRSMSRIKKDYIQVKSVDENEINL